MTALTTQRYAEKPFMQQVRDYVLRKCGDEALRRRFEEVGRTPAAGGGPGAPWGGAAARAVMGREGCRGWWGGQEGARRSVWRRAGEGARSVSG